MGLNVDAFQKLLDNAVAEGVAPGFQCVVFDREKVIYNGVSGFARLPSEDSPEGTPFKPETLMYLLSCTKLPISLVILHILENDLTRTGISLDDLDNHEALVKFLPEFKQGSGSLVTKILEGFEDEIGPDGRRVMKLRDAKTPVTLRMLLTHTAGIVYGISDDPMISLYFPPDGSVPHFVLPGKSGNIRDFSLPAILEPNTTWSYGWASEWLGLFATRSTGRTVRQLFKDIIFDPLDIPPSEADIWLSPSQLESIPAIYARQNDRDFMRMPPHDEYAVENEPPEGKAPLYGSCLFASSQAYAKILQGILNCDSRILSKEVWKIAMKDDLKDRGIKFPKPAWKTAVPSVTCDMDEFAKSTADNGTGVNLLQCLVATAPTVSGRSTGSFAWAGLANNYYFVDPVKGVGAMFGTQMYPFLEPRLIEMRDKLEALVYKVLE